MKGFALAAMLLPTIAQADGLSTCSHAADLANAIMTSRQEGAPPDKLMEGVLPTTPEESKGLMKDLILRAYEVPKFRTEKAKQDAISEYRTETFTRCMRAFE